jgi:hypothetical protein
LQAGPISLATTLGISVDFFSCSYLDVSVRRVRLAYLCIQYAMTLAGRVSPFGHLRIKARLPAPRSLSQATASFIACNRQGIHHVHLVACPYNVDLWDTAIPKTLQQHAVCTTVDACLIRYNHNPSAHPRFNCKRVTLRIIDLYYFFQFVKERTALLIAKDQT